MTGSNRGDCVTKTIHGVEVKRGSISPDFSDFLRLAGSRSALTISPDVEGKTVAEVMYFGKHKGSPVEDVPTDYLIWCATSLRKCPMPVIAELDRRLGLEALPKNRVVKKYLLRVKGITHIKPRTTVGAHYQRLRDQFQSQGGDSSLCPFDLAAHGYCYSGPTLSFVVGVPYMSGGNVAFDKHGQ